MSASDSRVQVPEVLKRRKCFLHIDLEQIRLGLSSDIPLVSQQWNAIIAVNYAAKKFGITRLHHNVFDAKQLCPATLGPGDSQPDYYPSPSRFTHKVSLDPYRKASAKIFSVFRKLCPKHQKGGLDEVFMDVTDIVNERIMEQYGNDLSNWDRESAEMINWRRDYPEVGVVFGLPLENPKECPNRTASYLDDSDEEDGEYGPGVLDGIKTDENENDIEGEEGGGGESELEAEVRHDVGNEDKRAPQDDFDLDLEQLMGNDFEDSFSISQSSENDISDRNTLGTAAQATRPKGPQSETPGSREENEETLEKSEEELRKEKEEEEERFQLEKEMLRPYYGIPEGTFEEEFWAEMQLLKAAEFCNEIRFAVKEELGYTCSAGIGNNRLLAKLGSGMNKPFNQTIVLPKYIPDLLHEIKLSKIRNLGGKFGKQVKKDYNIERASQLWPVPLRQLQQRYGEQAGLELWQWCRGIDHVGIQKIKSKSMCSHKSFMPAIWDMEEIQFWVYSMSLELVSRMQEEYEGTGRWPRTIALGFYGGQQAYQNQLECERKASFRAPHMGSRSMPLGSRFEYGGVEGIAKKMYGIVEKLIKEAETGGGRPIMPLILLTITVSNFSDGHESAMGDITKFFSKAPAQLQQNQLSTTEQKVKDKANEDASSPHSMQAESNTNELVDLSEASKKAEFGIRRRFFQPRATFKEHNDSHSPNSLQHLLVGQDPKFEIHDSVLPSSRSSPVPQHQDQEESDRSTEHMIEMTLLCKQCPSPGQQIPIAEWEEHTDYHFALNLLEDDRKQQKLERQQQQQQQRQHSTSVGNNSLSGSSNGAKRGSSSNASSTQGKRKKAGSSSTSSTASSNYSSTPPLARFFKPNAN
ncbi:DNA-directed DNA polymerase eta rad30 [Entomortierella chlamydospora]|uniref:DNA polymerase eta n=1 Tax=Entomortierella chlamydospora TaxID=101097 RepID=A0A9P6N1G7_9FUNG|nr:DNA-directed DNA polymerase eta rad30 [Entomortierella chlamydospora]KAG0021384.1 DNA-directed DNA polymerase eta rad30 [Entomortierella chlamydospora]